MLGRFATDQLLKKLSGITHGSIHITTPDGKTHHYTGSQDGSHAKVTLHDWGTGSVLLQRGDIGLAELYRDGRLDCDDLTALFLFGMQNQAGLDRVVMGGKLGMVWSQIRYWLNRNSIRGSRDNIHAHYDLGNEFYSLWLDPSMTYSSGIFHNRFDTLEQAQEQKYDCMIDRIRSSGSLLEIGCGWGGFADRALQRGDYAIKGLTISPAQHEYATQRLQQRATIALEDYRIQTGHYQHIISIEMFEAVGEAYWPIYFNKIKSLLAKSGSALIQTITIADACFDRYRLSGDAIRTFIFPGGMLASPSRFKAEAKRAGLDARPLLSFGLDYAKTLQEWLNRFESQLEPIRGLGFDQPFIQLWRFYLTCCIAGFLHQRTDVSQWELCHSS